MSSLPQHRTARSPSGVRLPAWLADDYLETYISWREECAAARRAYEVWDGAERPDRALAFAAFGAALDREERAAGLLRDRVERVRHCLALARAPRATSARQ